MELTQLDKELLDGLQVLTDLEISRVQAHLAAGLPMRYSYGWTAEERAGDQPACFGCLIGTAMGPTTYRNARWTRPKLNDLALGGFFNWLQDNHWLEPQLPAVAQNRLAALLDMEWSRRVMATSNPVEQTHDSAIIPSLEAVPV